MSNGSYKSSQLSACLAAANPQTMGAPRSLLDAHTVLLPPLSVHNPATDEAVVRSFEVAVPEDHQQRDLLYAAVSAEDVNQVRELLKNGVCPNQRGADGSTPLHLAVERGLPGIAMMLAYAGADLEARAGALNSTPLLLASAYGLTEVAKILIELGADVNAVGADAATPLSHAASNNDVRLVLALVKSGAFVDSRSCKGLTPLHIAACADNPKVITVLARHGANTGAPDMAGNTP